MSNEVYQIHFVVGNPAMFRKVRSTELMARREFEETWAEMNQNNGLHWRIWGTKRGIVMAQSVREEIWQQNQREDLNND